MPLSSTETNQSTPRVIPLVGIGASAGGLEAILDLMAEIPAASGMAFLVVQHLDPVRRSLLPEILSKRASVPVVEAVEGMHVEPDHLYVIPANVSMSVVARHIRLSPRDQMLGPPMPIDDLLDSLAKDQGSNAIGVVLSGSGSDGALGLQSIQHAGGITFAQDDSATFRSMPHAARNLGCVDRVLAPGAIAREIVEIGRHPYLRAVTTGGPASAAEPAEVSLRTVFRLLRNACNIDFSRYKDGTVQRRLARRMALQQVASVAEYAKMLESHPAETQALGRDLLIQVTEFFRDPESFEALAQIVFPRIAADGDWTGTLRIWVPGCATGEEVYSIAICLIEYLGERVARTSVQIFGTDISATALDTARAGRYIENIARNVSPERLERFFVRDGEYYCVDKSVRELCTFSRHDVLSDPPFSRMDLVSCRNLLIYLSAHAQRSVMPLFHYALKPDGVLMLGPSESVGAFSELFGVIESKRSRLYSKKPRLGPLAPIRAVPRVASLSASAVSARESRSESNETSSLRSEVERIALARYVPPSVLCDDQLNIVEYRGDTSAFLVNPSGPPTNNLQRLLRPELLLAVGEAVREVRQESVAVRKAGLRVRRENEPYSMVVEVHPVETAAIEGRWFLIFFEHGIRSTDDPHSEGQKSPKGQLLRSLKNRLARGQAARSADTDSDEIGRLTTELGAMRTQLRAMLEEHESAREELKSSEEELLSSNEEFQSTNEELETAKEELQSLNEELSTTNDELRYRNHELKTLHDDMILARDYADGIIDTMAEPLLVLEPDLRVTRVNHAFYRTFQTSAEQTIGAMLYQLGNGQWDIPSLRELLEKLLPQSTVVRDYHITHDFPRVGVRTMRLNAARVLSRTRELILLTIEDVTAHQRAVERLEAADHQKDDFLAMLAHELRNPLAAVSNAIEILGRDSVDEETKRLAHNLAKRQLIHEVKLVDDLLDVSRITRGIIKLNVEPIDLGIIVHQGIAAMRADIDARKHELTLALPNEPVIVDGDAIRVEQIVTNLLGNAVKYTPAQGRLHISLERDGGEAVLTVADNGIGMEATLLPNIFHIFVQAERALDRASAGLGLGLALVRKLTALHHGTVRASSEGLGLGSQFVVRLPISPLRYASQPRASEAMQDTAVVVQRILVVDDNQDAAQSTAMVLQLEGHVVEVEFDGLSALRRVKHFRPNVVLLDIGLPDMDGYEIARQLRTMPECAKTILIAVSGYAHTESRDRAREAGFDHYLVKPTDLNRLNPLIASAPREEQR